MSALRKTSMYLPSFLFFLFLSTYGFTQVDDFSMRSSDNEVGVDVARGEKGVEITLRFSKATQYECVMIEKSGDSQAGFSQCKYIKFNESANDSVVIVKRDSYPLTATMDVYYRVKVITKEGASRVYPSVRLPGLKELKTK